MMEKKGIFITKDGFNKLVNFLINDKMEVIIPESSNIPYLLFNGYISEEELKEIFTKLITNVIAVELKKYLESKNCKTFELELSDKETLTYCPLSTVGEDAIDVEAEKLWNIVGKTVFENYVDKIVNQIKEKMREKYKDKWMEFN